MKSITILLHVVVSAGLLIAGCQHSAPNKTVAVSKQPAVTTMQNQPLAPGHQLDSNDLTQFVEGATTAAPNASAKSSAIVDLPCGQAMYLKQKVPAEKGHPTYIGYLYAIPHGSAVFFVAITMPETQTDGDDLQHTMATSFAIKD
jgi:hypothetical protein